MGVPGLVCFKPSWGVVEDGLGRPVRLERRGDPIKDKPHPFSGERGEGDEEGCLRCL